MNQDLSDLYNAITENRGKPLDFWEVAALLEIYGIRDIDAQNEYHFENVFAMAEYMMQYKNGKTYPVKALVNFEELPPFWVRVFKNYMRGLAFAMPMFVQIFFTFSIGYAIWSGIGMDQMKATVIALGTFLALIVTGSSAQAIGRKGLFYLKQEEVVLTANVTKVLLNVGYVLVVVVGLALIFINFFFEILPTYYFFIMIVFFFLLSFLFLNISVYYMFEEYYQILYFFLLGIVFVYIAHGLFKVKLPEAQFISLILLDTIITLLAYRKIKNLKKNNIKSEGKGVQRASILFYSLIPFYSYGFLYFVFLVADRMIAWSTNLDAKPYFIWFNVAYELGLDWALIALVLLMGFTEISIYELTYRINDIIVKYRYRDYREFNNEIYSFFKRFNGVYLILSVVIIFFTYFAMYIANIYLENEIVKNFFKSYTPFVFWMAAISYAFMTNGLMNVLFIFSFSRQNFSLKAISIATLVNLIVGVLLSRIFGVEYAVYGLLVGSIVFWGYSFSYAIEMFKKLEFYYYSSF